MALIRVTSAQLQSGAQELANLNSQFKSAVQQLENTEQALAGMWEGDAKEAFHRAFNSDKIQMDNFYNAIEVYITRLQNAAAKYQQAEALNVDTANTRTYH